MLDTHGNWTISSSLPLVVDSYNSLTHMAPLQADKLAGPLFGMSLVPYLCFLYFLSRPAVNTPRGVIVGFSTCLLFVLCTICASICANMWYEVSLADCDWLHGSAESVLMLTNMVTAVAFRQALRAQIAQNKSDPGIDNTRTLMPIWVVLGTLAAGVTFAVPALQPGTTVHTPFLGGFLDLPLHTPFLGGFLDLPPWYGSYYMHKASSPLSTACWIVHVSSLLEYFVVMDSCWRWAAVTGRPSWRGLTWGLLPLHTAGLTACVYHLFYNRIAFLPPLQALLTCMGNITAAYAGWRIARESGWAISTPGEVQFWKDQVKQVVEQEEHPKNDTGFRARLDLGNEEGHDFVFFIKLFVGSAVASYMLKYGQDWFDCSFDDDTVFVALVLIIVPSLLHACYWSRRSSTYLYEA